MADQDKTQGDTYVVPARLRRLYETIDSSLMEFGSLEPRQKAIMALAKELHVDKAQMQELVNHARENHPQINAIARVHKLIENAKASGKKPDLSMFRRLQPAAKSAGKDDMWLGAQLGYIPQFIEEAANKDKKTKTKVLPILLSVLVVLAVVGGIVWKVTYGDLIKEQNAALALDNQAWKEAQDQDDADAYRSYLRNHPNGEYAVTAKGRLGMMDEEAWRQTQQQGSRAAYEGYLNEFDLHREQAVAMLDTLLHGDQFSDCTGCPEMVSVRAGAFDMGGPEGDFDELPVHEVEISQPIAVSIAEVTFSEWDRCAAEGACKKNVSDSGWGRGKHPVMNVNWHDANDYVSWLSQESGHRYRLLTEAEWEYVARSGSSAAFWWGNKPAIERAVCDGCKALNNSTVEVGEYKANAFGLVDTSGNVAEWVADCWHEDYKGAPSDGSAWLEGNGGDCTRAVVRGGSWLSEPLAVRSASRDRAVKTSSDINIGFRVAREF